RNNNPLDLNNLPEDFIRDHSISKQPLEYHSSSAVSGIYKKKKNSGKDEKGKIYECRFCSLKFGKSQALGGHMNRHRQERETETLNQARQLVFSSENMSMPPPHQLGGQAPVHGGYHYPAGFNMGGATVYPSRLFSGTSTTMLPTQPPPPPPHMFTSMPSRLNAPYPSQYPNSQPINDYFVDPYASNHSQFRPQNLSCAVAPAPYN
ncbi:zinc finger protein JAGGED-like protein, partial [Tanacetum coccineum]